MTRPPDHLRPAPPPGCHARSGLTLIEVVVALATLVIAAGALLGGSTFVASLATRDRVRMDAIEIAHRVILQHIEDHSFWNEQPKRAEIGGRYYAFTLDEEVVQSPDDSREVRASATGRRSTTTYTSDSLAKVKGEGAVSALNRLVVRVYPDDDNTGTAGKIAAAELVRYHSWFTSVDQENVVGEVLRRAGRMLDDTGLGTSPAPR